MGTNYALATQLFNHLRLRNETGSWALFERSTSRLVLTLMESLATKGGMRSSRGTSAVGFYVPIMATFFPRASLQLQGTSREPVTSLQLDNMWKCHDSSPRTSFEIVSIPGFGKACVVAF